MPALSPTELGRLRDQHPGAARVEWYLAVAPYGDACFTAQVNDAAIVRGAMTIAYIGDAGTDVNVGAGMTLWIGSAAGAYDIGTVRIRSINTVADTLSVAENDHIEWADGLHLTCPGTMGFREPWGVYQRMTEAAGVVTFYQDYDITYNDPPDDVLPPKANAGPPVCAWLGTGGNADVSFVGEQSYTTEVGAALNPVCAWDFADGVVISGAANTLGTCAVPNVVRFTTPGFRYVSLTVTDNTAQARTAIVYVPVWIFQEGVEEPFGKVEVLSQSGDLSGWSCRLRVFQTDTAAESDIYHFPPGALVALFTKTWFGGSEYSVGGFCHRENVRFVGWLDRETLKFDYEAGFVEFEAIGNGKLLNRIPGFAFTLEDDDTPSDWYEMNDLNVDRALHHLLHYHSTVNQVCHVERVGEGDTRVLKIQIFPDASLYSQAQDHLLKDAQCLLVADRQGILRATQDPQFLDAADRGSVAIVCDLEPIDWMGDLDATSPHVPRVGLVRLGGFHYDIPLLSQAPGVAPRQQEAELRVEGCILQGQAEANLWSGLALTKENNEFPQVPMTLSGYWPVFDPAFQEYLRLTTTDPLERNAWVNKRFIIRGVAFRDLPAAGTTTTTLTLEAESVIQAGEYVEVPIPPPPEPPDPPDPPIPPPPDPPWEGPIKACVAWTKDAVAYTPDLLLRHTVSVTTAGTGGVDLFDTTADFVTLGIVVGDVIENLATSASTHVTMVVSATRLTLAANIGLGVGSDYSTCGTQWTDITPAGYTGLIFQFLYVRTGLATVGGWLLTTEEVYWAPDVLTPSPTWTCMLTIAAVRIAVGYISNKVLFRGMHAKIDSSGYLIVSFLMRDQAANTFGCVYTGNTGGAWAYSTFLPGYQDRCPYFALEIDEVNGMIFHAAGTSARCWVFTSVDGGANFARAPLRVGNGVNYDTRADLYRPYSGANLYVTIRNSTTSPGISTDDGSSWTILTAVVPPGYHDLGGKTGVNGWYGDTNDILCMWEADDDNHDCLLRSADGGSTWIEIGDANVRFPWIPGGWTNSRAVVAETWVPDEEVLVWTGIAPSEAVIENCRIKFTHDDGVVWSGKMGNWYTIFPVLRWAGAYETSGNSGGAGCIPLPRVGANE